MPYSGTAGRARLIEAARTLFAERGIDNVSMREVTRAAGQRNTNAVQYHFGGREKLLAAVIRPHHERVAAERVVLLDALEAGSAPTDRALAEALVLPLAPMLDDEDGRCYLRIMARLGRDPSRLKALGLVSSGLVRWDRLVQGSLGPRTGPLHRAFSAMNLCLGEFEHRAGRGHRPDHRLFVANVVDLVRAVLAAEASGRTMALLDERDLPWGEAWPLPDEAGVGALDRSSGRA